MVRLCERPGCSDPGAAAYGMRPEDLVFWVAPLDARSHREHGVLCQRHADAMVVPRGWTLDDLREPVPRLFRPKSPRRGTAPDRPAPAARRRPTAARVEQLELDPDPGGAAPASDGPHTAEPGEATTDAAVAAADGSVGDRGWAASFDVDDDLDGLLEVRSPLLARAFRGQGRPRRPSGS